MRVVAVFKSLQVVRPVFITAVKCRYSNLQLYKATTFSKQPCRLYFTRKYLGVDRFQDKTVEIATANASNFSHIKQSLETALTEPNGRVLNDHLCMFLYLVKTDKDLDLLLKGLKRYQSQQTVLDFSLSEPLMQLLYESYRTEKAFELFVAKDTEFFRTKSVAVLLMNKLFEEKRYNAVVDTYKQISCGGGSGRLIPEAVELMFDALVEKNTPDSFKMAVDMMNSINQGFLNDRCTRKVFLLALGQNNPKFALKMLSSLKRMRQDKMLSMRIVALNALDRTEEVASDAIQLLKIRPKAKFFKETTDALKQSLAKATTNEVKAKLKEAVEYGEYRFNINNEDMRTYILKNFDIFPPRIDEDQGISVQQQPDSEKKKPSQETVKNQAKSVNKKAGTDVTKKVYAPKRQVVSNQQIKSIKNYK